MSAAELVAWDSMSPAWVQHIEQTRQATRSTERPARFAVELVGRILCGAVIAGKGWADPTYKQIRDKAHGCLSDSQVKRALQVLESAQAIRTVSRPTRGKQGKAGRAPKRVVLFTLSPEPNHGSPERTVISDESRVANDRITGRSDLNHGSPERTALIQDSYKTPKESEQSERVRVTTADSLQREKKSKETEPETQHLPGHMTMQTVNQITTRALEIAGHADPTFTPRKAWFIARRGDMMNLVIALADEFPQATATALEQAAALDLYNELDRPALQVKKPELWRALTGEQPPVQQQTGQDLVRDIAAAWAMPPDPVVF